MESTSDGRRVFPSRGGIRWTSLDPDALNKRWGRASTLRGAGSAGQRWSVSQVTQIRVSGIGCSAARVASARAERSKSTLATCSATRGACEHHDWGSYGVVATPGAKALGTMRLRWRTRKRGRPLIGW